MVVDTNVGISNEEIPLPLVDGTSAVVVRCCAISFSSKDRLAIVLLVIGGFIKAVVVVVEMGLLTLMP